MIQKAELSVTLFALDKSEGLSTHAASGDALVIPLEGTNHIEIGKKPFDIKQGDCIILPANIAHSLKATSRFKMFLTVVK
ncbi:MAG: hypothetical protein BKP49_09965 [Treponema sp. CETP13]|nr:MAG: hypothetical protein BKP49_09965 [Treponema sp. CETP13]